MVMSSYSIKTYSRNYIIRLYEIFGWLQTRRLVNATKSIRTLSGYFKSMVYGTYFPTDEKDGIDYANVLIWSLYLVRLGAEKSLAI